MKKARSVLFSSLRHPSIRGGSSADAARRQHGQAAIELAAGILLFLLILTGILHVNRMSRTSLFLHSVLRGNAGEEAMSDSLTSIAPQYISDWDEGADGVKYTADDKPVSHTIAFSSILGTLLDRSAQTPSDWALVADDTQLPVSMIRLHESPALATAMGFTHAEETLHVPVDPVIRALVYGKDEVAIKEGVWMPLMGGLY